MVNEWIRANSAPFAPPAVAVTQAEADCIAWLRSWETAAGPSTVLVQRAEDLRARMQAAVETLKQQEKNR
jgi:hypothetical protein